MDDSCKDRLPFSRMRNDRKDEERRIGLQRQLTPQLKIYCFVQLKLRHPVSPYRVSVCQSVIDSLPSSSFRRDTICSLFIIEEKNKVKEGNRYRITVEPETVLGIIANLFDTQRQEEGQTTLTERLVCHTKSTSSIQDFEQHMCDSNNGSLPMYSFRGVFQKRRDQR